MNNILLTHKRGSHKTLWFGLIGAIIVIVGSILFSHAQTQKIENQKMNPTKPVPNDAELQRKLTKDQYYVTRECGTETPFQNAYWDNHQAGIYVDIITGEPLFTSLDKFDSGTGWPSFTKPIAKEKVVEKSDLTLGMDRYRQVIRDFIALLGSRANLALPHITPKDVLAYRNSITKTGKAARTANLSVKVVSAAFNAAVRQHIIESNPATALESLPVKAEERATFTPAQVSKLIRAAEGDWRGAILLGYYTGARLGDVANMRWSTIDLDHRLIRFTPSKTKKPVTI